MKTVEKKRFSYQYDDYRIYAPNKSKIINTNTEKMHFTLQSLKDWYVISLFIYWLNDLLVKC